MAFATTAVPLATEAALHLVALGDFDGRSSAGEVLARLQPSVQELGRSGLALLGGRALETPQPLLRPRAGYELRLLGQATALRDGEAVRVRPRGLEILALLSAHPEGMTAASLAEGIYGEEAAALRVELYRLRRALGAELERSPYRLTGIGSDVQDIDTLLRSGRVREAVGRYRGPLLPQSQAPGVVALREALETQLVEAALLSGDLETIWNLVQVVTDDLRLWEAMLQLPAGDPRRYAVKGRVAWLRKELGL